MTPQPGLKTIAIHTLPNISQSKGNQTMKIGQLTAYNNRNIFLQKLCDVLTYMLKRHNILPTKTTFFISSQGKIKSIQEFKIKLFD